MASWEELSAEAPYALDDEMKRWAQSLGSVNASGRPAREEELARRLLGRAEAWPAHSLALAHVRTMLLAALDKARRARGASALTPASAEERALLSSIDATVAAHLAAGTLMRCTPSENGFNADLAAAFTALLGRGDAPPAGNELGYMVTLMSGSVHLVGLLEAIMTGQPAAAPAHGEALLRVLAFIAAQRSDPASPLRPHLLLDQEADISEKMELFAQVVRARDATGLPLARHLPAGLLAQLESAWARVQDALGPTAAAAAVAEGRAGVAAQEARREAQHAGWEPRACAHCGAPETEPKQWKVCARCHGPAYCSKEHQAAHWRAGRHRKECREADGADSKA